MLCLNDEGRIRFRAALEEYRLLEEETGICAYGAVLTDECI
jgi:hypothetical protein